MRIGIDVFPLCSRFPATGIPRAVREILRELQRLDQENEYYLYSKQDFDFPLENPRWHKRLHLGIPYLLGNLYLRIKDGIERPGKDGLDVFWTTRTHSFPVGLPSSVGRVLTVYDVVWLLHPDTMEDANRAGHRRFANRGIRQAHKIIAISESTRQGLIETTGAAGGKIEVVHLAVNAGFTPRDRDQSARFIAEKYGASPDYICTVGTVEPRKNVITLIEAVRILRDRGQLRHQLLIAGQSGWKNSDIYARVEGCGLTEREVKFLGRVPDDDLALLYSGAALFVFPSLYEGFGLPLLEAMACGVPVVASNTSSIPEVVQDAGILVSPQRPEEFADAIVRVTSDAALSRSLAEKGLRRAREFTWQAAAVKTLWVLEQAARIVGCLPGGGSAGRSAELRAVEQAGLSADMRTTQEQNRMAEEAEHETLYSCDLCGSEQIDALDADCCICACQACGYVFDNPRPTARAIAAFYSRPAKYNHWLAAEVARDRLWQRRVKKMRRTRKPGSLLDVGTGVGQFLAHARPYYSSVAGTEVSEAAIRIAKGKYNLVIEEGELGNIHLPESAFDNITLFHVLEHVPSPRSLIERCRALLKDGGILVIAVPNDLGSLVTRIRLLLKGLGFGKYRSFGRLGLSRITLDGSMDEVHLSHFRPDVLQRLLEAAGFRVLENTLDPQYAAEGLKEIIWGLYYAAGSVLRSVLRTNLYETIWVVARKTRPT